MSENKDLRPVGEEPQKDESKSIKGAKKQNTRAFLWVVCALYLLYLVSKLVKDLFAGKIDSQGTRIMVIVASIVFTTAAIYLLVVSIRHGLASLKESVRATAAALDEPDEPAEQLAEEYEEDYELAADDMPAADDEKKES